MKNKSSIKLYRPNGDYYEQCIGCGITRALFSPLYNVEKKKVTNLIDNSNEKTFAGGKLAFLNRAKLSDNPYPLGSESFNTWVSGWKSQADESNAYEWKNKNPIAYRNNILLFPFRLLWNIIVIVGTIWLEVLWIGFVFGSVAGVILLLLFWIEGFLFPLILFGFCTELWPRREEDEGNTLICD